VLNPDIGNNLDVYLGRGIFNKLMYLPRMTDEKLVILIRRALFARTSGHCTRFSSELLLKKEGVGRRV
jgi:hypothetical protein